MIEEVQKFLDELIDFYDWDAAKWKLTAFNSPVETMLPPCLIIVFTHDEAARSAFAALRSKVGQEDEEELIRVSIVEGAFSGNPHSYAVKIAPEVNNVLKHFELKLGQGEHVPVVALSRFKWMNPSGPSQHLARFKEQFDKAGSYLLMPGCLRGESLAPIENLGILKRSIHFRRTEDILSGDQDAVVLRDE